MMLEWNIKRKVVLGVSPGVGGGGGGGGHIDMCHLRGRGHVLGTADLKQFSGRRRRTFTISPVIYSYSNRKRFFRSTWQSHKVLST